MRRIAVSIGDPNGIGAEIVLKALQQVRSTPDIRITVFGAHDVLARAAAFLGLEELLETVDLREAGTLAEADARFGKVNAEAGASAIASATAAIQACQAGEFDAVVAGPHHETAVSLAGIAFSGYPSLVARVCGQPEHSVFLLLVGAGLRIVHATLHERTADAVSRIDTALVVAAARAGIRGCQALGVDRPRLGFFGINPHGSEGGLFGHEDMAYVEPAVAQIRALGFDADGPTGADVLLAQREHDLYVAMLHDQGHIPIKLLAPQGATAISVGADVLLATTGHGSAMDIAGQGVAKAGALLRSIHLVSGMALKEHA